MGGARTICCYHVFPSLAHEKGLFHITSNWFIAVFLIFLFLPVEIKPITVGIIRFYRIWLLGKLILRKKGFFFHKNLVVLNDKPHAFIWSC